MHVCKMSIVPTCKQVLLFMTTIRRTGNSVRIAH